jgi:hypothetical protein
MPSNGYNLQAHVIDGKIFVLSTISSDLYMYDLGNDSWTEKTDMPLPNGSFWIFGKCLVSAVVDNKIIVWMLQLKPDIYTYNFDSETTEQKTIVYNPTTDMWDERNIEPVTFVGSGVAGATTGGYAPKNVYSLKWDSSGEQTINQVYDPVKDMWTTAKIMPTPRRDFGVAVIDDILYVIGGRVAKLATDSDVPHLIYESSSVNEQYIPLGYHGALPPYASLHVTPTHSGAFLNRTAITVTILVICAVAAALCYYLSGKKKTTVNMYE